VRLTLSLCCFTACSCVRQGFPPGPPGDQSLSLLSDPLACISRLRREHGALVGLLLGGERVVLVADPAAAKQVSGHTQAVWGACCRQRTHVLLTGIITQFISRLVWCGVVWCGVVWCGVVWCGVVWCGVVWCGVVWCGVVWCGLCSRRVNYIDVRIWHQGCAM
jgi:hypothetical protein